jgi:hypothetical protein
VTTNPKEKTMDDDIHPAANAAERAARGFLLIRGALRDVVGHTAPPAVVTDSLGMLAAAEIGVNFFLGPKPHVEPTDDPPAA